MKNDNGMSFWEKWYWVNYLRGTNPITTFISELIYGLWIPITCFLIFCFVTDPQWAHVEGMTSWSPRWYLWYVHYEAYGIITILSKCFWEYVSFAWNHMGTIGRFWRHVMWLDHPEYFPSN